MLNIPPMACPALSCYPIIIAAQMKAPVMIMEIVATRYPVPQCGEDSLPSRHHTFLKLSVVAMPEDHGVKALPESIPGETRHLSGNNLLGAAHILLTDLGTPAGRGRSRCRTKNVLLRRIRRKRR